MVTPNEITHKFYICVEFPSFKTYLNKALYVVKSFMKINYTYMQIMIKYL